jgi:folate-dependent phosphoribosylglycinamide formyltransferase PurN
MEDLVIDATKMFTRILSTSEIKENYPKLLKTKLDRGYKIIDLITLSGFLKLIPLQFYRKWKKKQLNQPHLIR